MTFQKFLVENECNEDEANMLSFHLLSLRNKTINFHVLESLIREYQSLLFNHNKICINKQYIKAPMQHLLQ